MSTNTTSTLNTGSSPTTNGNGKEKEPFKVRAELFAPTRLAPKAYAFFRARSLVTDVVAHECLLLVLLAAKSAMLSTDITQMELPRVGVLGGGYIGCAVVMALLKHAYPVDKLAISTRQPERTPKCEALLLQNACGGSLLPQYHAITKYYDNARLSRESDVLILCMPPSQLKSVAIQIKHALGVGANEAPPTLVVSVLCGASRELLQKSCGTKLVARAKVNVPKLTGKSEDAGESGDDLKEDDDGTAAVGNGEESEERATSSSVESAARELGTSHLNFLCMTSMTVWLVTYKGLTNWLTDHVVGIVVVVVVVVLEAREPQDVATLLQVLTDLSARQLEQDSDSPLLAQKAAQQAHSALFDCSTEDDEALAKQLRPEQGSEGGDAWHAGWDKLLAVLQRTMRQRSTSTVPSE